MSKLANKVAVVTGASKGIGAGIAKALAAEGAAVVVNYASSKEGAESVPSAVGHLDAPIVDIDRSDPSAKVQVDLMLIIKLG